MVLGKPGSHMQKNETGPLSYTIYIKNKFKMDERPKCEPETNQRRKDRQQRL